MLVNLSLGDLGLLGELFQELLDDIELSHQHGVPVLLDLDIDAGEAELLLLQGVQDVVGDNASHSLQLDTKLQLLDEGGCDNSGGGSGDTALAVEDDGGGGRGALQHGDNLVKVGLSGGLLLVHGNSQGIELGHLLLESSIDLIDGLDTLQLLGERVVGGSLFGVLSKLVLVVLELITSLLQLLSGIDLIDG